MSVSKEERKAYEDGREEGEFIKKHPISYLLTGGIHSRPSDDSEAEVYDKGLKGEQLDEDKTSNGSSGCFLSTACANARGLADNCSELDALRNFRDVYRAYA